jgi:YD repeat-containing protein
VITPDGAQVNTQYSGNQVTVIDQAGKRRRSETDALGRLTKVIEAPGGVGYETNYEYDTLNNLRKVKQGPQERIFAYDSMSRLTSATNPESGTVIYLWSEPTFGDGLPPIRACSRISSAPFLWGKKKSQVYANLA